MVQKDPNEIIKTLKDEVESLATQAHQYKLSPDPRDRKVLEKSIRSLIAKLDTAVTTETPHRPIVAPVSNTLKKVTVAAPEDLSDPEATEVLVKRLGTPRACSDCGKTQCGCFAHLSAPLLKIESDGKMKITFGEDFNDMDRMNYLKQMRLAVEKKRGSK